MTTEQRVHGAALALFGKKGFANTSVRDIAKAAGISSASLYHYMPAKEDLLVAVTLSAMRPLIEPARAIHESGRVAEWRLARLVHHHVTMHTETKAVWDVVDEEWRRFDARRRAPIVAYRDEYQAMWFSAISDGFEAGVFSGDDPRTATFAVLGMCSSVYKWFAKGGRLSVGEVADQYVRLAFTMLGADSAAAVEQTREAA
jgi:AcrR family transcriptional regulator